MLLFIDECLCVFVLVCVVLCILDVGPCVVVLLLDLCVFAIRVFLSSMFLVTYVCST